MAFKLGQALVDSVDTDAGERYRSYALPLVALATIGDYMSLTLENRAIARAGYERLFDCGLPGLGQTAEHCDVSSISDLRWSLVPLRNASQEAESGDLLLKLLFAEDQNRISVMMCQLEAFRDERRQKRQERQAHLDECFSRQFDPPADEHLVFLVETE